MIKQEQRRATGFLSHLSGDEDRELFVKKDDKFLSHLSGDEGKGGQV